MKRRMKVKECREAIQQFWMICSIFIMLTIMDPRHLQWQGGVMAQSSLIKSRHDLERRLQAMTDEELEQICIERGFELIKDEIDEETGLPMVSSHQDFVDAAWQCLQM
jgi:hypothetical protein